MSYFRKSITLKLVLVLFVPNFSIQANDIRWNMVRRLSSNSNSQRDVTMRMVERLKTEPNPAVAVELGKRLVNDLDLKVVVAMINEVARAVDLRVPMEFGKIIAMIPDFKVTKKVADVITKSFDPQAVMRLSNVLLNRLEDNDNFKIPRSIINQLPNDGGLALKLLLHNFKGEGASDLKRLIRLARLVSFSSEDSDAFIALGSGFRGEMTEVAGDIVTLTVASNRPIKIKRDLIEFEKGALSFLGVKCKNGGGISVCDLRLKVASDLEGRMMERVYFSPEAFWSSADNPTEWEVPVRIKILPNI